MAEVQYKDIDLRGYIDHNKNELRNARLQQLGADISSPVEGLFFERTDTHKMRVYLNGAWVDMATMADVTAGGISSSIVDAKGDIIVATANDTVARKAVGSNGQVIFANSAQGDGLEWRTPVPGDISGFDTQVRTSRLDQMAAPTASVSLNSQKITNLLDPTGAQDAASKAYVDATAAGIDWKKSVRAATTTNGTLASAYENGDAIDGVTLATGDRILLKDQSTAAENGIYTVNASGAPTRATDADANAEVTAGMAVFVEEGTANADTGWVLTTNGAITVGSTSLAFAQFTALGQVSAGNGLTKTGSTLDVVGGTGISVAADSVSIDTAVVVRKFAAALTGGAVSEVVTHNLGTRDVHVELINNATPWDKVEVGWEATSTNTITLRSPVNLPTSYRCVVFG